MPETPGRAKPDSRFAFLNVPFDKEFEPLYLAFIAGLSGFGLVPQTMLQIPGSDRRLDRLTNLLARCHYSFHDLSRVELDGKRPRVPRFNMPFELGLAVGMEAHGENEHFWYAFEAKRFRALKTISDLNGTEIYIHRSTAKGLFQCLVNALAREQHRPTVQDLMAIHRDVTKAAKNIRNDIGASSLYETRPFQDLVIAASLSAKQRIRSLQKLSVAAQI